MIFKSTYTHQVFHSIAVNIENAKGYDRKSKSFLVTQL